MTSFDANKNYNEVLPHTVIKVIIKKSTNKCWKGCR